MTIHIKFDLPEETKSYHKSLRRALLFLVEECQKRESRTDISVLDVGCGRGEILSEIRSLGAHVEGVDMEEECVLLSQQYAEVKRGNIYDLPDLYSDSEFDVVIASHLLEHLENPKHGIEMLKRISRKYLILAVPNLAEFRNVSWFARTPGLVNRGHQVGWDPAHFNTFLTHACDLTILQWQPDRVFAFPIRFHGVVDKFGLLGAIYYVQDNWLTKLFPLQSHSIITLCSMENEL